MRSNKPSWVYLIQDVATRCIKIGWAVDPPSRLRTLQKQPTLLPRPHKFRLLSAWQGDRHTESELHRRFSDKRVRGEWFRLDDEDLNEIRWFFFDAVNYTSRRTEFEIYEETMALAEGAAAVDFLQGTGEMF